MKIKIKDSDNPILLSVPEADVEEFENVLAEKEIFFKDVGDEANGNILYEVDENIETVKSIFKI